jgi:hypothetical protein
MNRTFLFAAVVALAACEKTPDVKDAGLDACVSACGVGCPSQEFLVCGQSGQRYCNSCIASCHADPVVTCPTDAGTDAGQNGSDGGMQACFDACGVGCPAPAYWVCGSSGDRYCNSCIAGCYADPVVTCPQSDAGVADGGQLLSCLNACGVGCPAPEYWVCGQSGERYCNSCVATCYADSVVACTDGGTPDSGQTLCLLSTQSSCGLRAVDGGAVPDGFCGPTAVSAGCGCAKFGASYQPLCTGACLPPADGGTSLTCDLHTNCGSITCSTGTSCTSAGHCD